MLLVRIEEAKTIVGTPIHRMYDIGDIRLTVDGMCISENGRNYLPGGCIPSIGLLIAIEY